MEQQYAPYEAHRRELDQARTRLEAVAATIESILAQQQERKLAVDEAERELTDLTSQLADDPDLQRKWQQASDECDRLETEKSALWSRQGGLEGQIAELDRLQIERDNLDKDAVTLALDHGALRELVEAFGRNGIQAMIVENILPELEDESNRLLRQMSSAQLNVSFRSQRQALSSDNIIETLDIIIRDEYGERPYSLYSGGEAFRINFAVRVALSRLLARRAGASVDMLVIDEGFGTQDSHGRDGLIEALRSVEEDFRTILVITHIGEIRELFPTRIDVTKTERGSQVCVN
jgi:exonuclease SbcC